MDPPLYLLFSILISACRGNRPVEIVAGRNVTLPCGYNAVDTGGPVPTCWGRGELPMSRCSDTILSTREGRVTYRESARFRLLGGARDGDVSLTIIHVQSGDSGLYGCRVEIPGWFNDLKVHRVLVVVEEEEVTSSIYEKTASDIAMMKKNIKDEEEIQTFLSIGNIGRMTALFTATIVVILLLLSSQMFLKGGTPAYKERIYGNV